VPPKPKIRFQRSVTLEVDVASQGQSIHGALANLAEAVELYLDDVDDLAGHVASTPLVTSFRLSGAA
jgi:predicted RNase H-like HicB family nuclease